MLTGDLILLGVVPAFVTAFLGSYANLNQKTRKWEPNMKKVQAETLTGITSIFKNQPVYVSSGIPGKVYNGIILTPSKKLSLVRFNEDGVLMETRVKNTLLIPVIPKNAKVRVKD